MTGSARTHLQTLQARQENKSREWFHWFACECGRLAGKPVAFILASAAIVLWAVTGPIFGYSDTWQLVINTGTTIITFLMVFLIQHSQNRDTLALQVKLSELDSRRGGRPQQDRGRRRIRSGSA
ncbi:low affinity iron permease family protein [Bradyrhizobium sp. BR 1432]|uniref:low affinity iron permease family protein n=1 Tax=Bradyrhizobium sp. BR 1432 TaxID=3447966 RepID=UPI003EE66DF1